MVGFVVGAAITSWWSTPALVGDLSGRWCAEDPVIGCYAFDAEGVIEEANGPFPETRGRWDVQAGLLILRFPNGSWTLEPVRRAEGVLVLRDLDRDEVVVLVKSER